MDNPKLIAAIPAVILFFLGGMVQRQYVKTRKIGAIFMGLFFDGLGVWWLLRVLDGPPVAVKGVLIAALALGAIGLITDALGIGARQ